MIDMTIEDVIASGERLDTSDTAVALRLARAATRSEADAYELLAQAQERAEAFSRAPEFRRAVRRVAKELLLHRELDGADIKTLTKELHDG